MCAVGNDFLTCHGMRICEVMVREGEGNREVSGRIDVLVMVRCCLWLFCSRFQARITVHPDLAFGVAGCGQAIPPNATLVYELELLRFVSECAVYGAEERLQGASRAKEAGNALFQLGEVTKASKGTCILISLTSTIAGRSFACLSLLQPQTVFSLRCSTAT